ncbi:cupric reductase activity protein [Dispira parvispora]|uniref:Cupric reductase activity protein n=1 Tax=Dispira parvispora TaxID=1520584 RepID=A0A9W8ASD3_9FUNG|nr:cupric reductase activity protein [Dispira parvispora]
MSSDIMATEISGEKTSQTDSTDYIAVDTKLQDASRDTLLAGYSIAVLGSGWFGRALVKRLNDAGYAVHLGRRNPQLGNPIGFDLPVLATSYNDAVECARVIFLAIPPQAHPEFVQTYGPLLQGKIVVDVSNPRSEAELKKLGRSLAETLAMGLPSAQIVKALNTVSAYHLENQIRGANTHVPVCCDHVEAQREVMNIVRSIGHTPVDGGSLRMSRALERENFRLFSGWWGSVVFASIVLGVGLLYVCIRTHILLQKGNFDGLPLESTNQVVGCTAIVLLASVNLAGVVANVWQLVHRTARRSFPAWLANWLNARKSLGILAIFMILFHAIASLVMIPQFDHGTEPGIPARIGASLLTAIIATLFYIVLAATSFPAVAASMSWAEWRFIQSGLGWWALGFAVLHIILMRLAPWQETQRYPHHMPPLSILAVIPAMLALFLKIVLSLPPVSNYLTYIQNCR